MHGVKNTPSLTALCALLIKKGKQSQQEKNSMNNLPWQIKTIINVAIQLKNTDSTAASTGERIAAAFVLNRMDYLPDSYNNVIDAWDRLDDWQHYVRVIKRDYMHLIEAG